MKRLGVILSLLFTFTLHAQDCNYSISGKVTDEHDGSDLSFSTVHILGTTQGTVADENGFYELKNLCAGKYKVVASHIGCEPDTVSVDLKGDVVLNLFLEHHAEELREVSIEAKRNSITLSRNKIDAEMLSNNSAKPIAQILSKTNGVSLLNSGANVSKPVINGMKNNRIKIIQQGIELQSQQWGDEHAPEMDPFAASDYEVIKGAGGIKYASGALGGVVIAKPRALPYKNGVNGSLHSLYASNNKMFYQAATLEGKNKHLPNFAWRLQGSWKKAGYSKTPDYYLKNTAANELNGSALIGYSNEKLKVHFFYSQFNTRIGIFTGAHIGNLSDLRAAIERKEPRENDRSTFSYTIQRPYQRVIHELAKVDATYYTDNYGKIQFTLARQFNLREEFDKDVPRNTALAELDIPEFSLGLETYAAKVDWEIDAGWIQDAEWGLEIQKLNNTVNSFLDFIPDYQQEQYSSYFTKDWHGEKLNYSAGFRFDYITYDVEKRVQRAMMTHFHKSYSNYSATVGINKNWKWRHQLYVNAVIAQRAAAINELFSDGLHHGAASLEYGNSNLGKETSYDLNADYTYTYRNIKLKSYLYLRYIEDFIHLVPSGLELTIKGAYPAYQWKNTNALIRGIDQSASWQLLPQIELYSQVSLLWGDNLSTKNYLINMPAHQWRNEINYNLNKGTYSWDFSLGNQWVAQQHRYNVEEEIAKPPKAYNLFLAHINLKMNLPNKTQLNISIEGENLLNTNYRNYLNRFRYFSDEVGRNFSLRINYQF